MPPQDDPAAATPPVGDAQQPVMPPMGDTTPAPEAPAMGGEETPAPEAPAMGGEETPAPEAPAM